VVKVFEACGLVQYASDQGQALIVDSIIREVGALNAVQNHDGLICKAIDHGVTPLEQVLHHVHVLGLFFKPQEEGHHMCGLASVTT